MSRALIVSLCGVIRNRKWEGKLFDWSKTHEFPEEPGNIVHLGHDDVLLLAAAVMLGADWNQGRAEWVPLIIREWHKHVRARVKCLALLGELEIDCGWAVEGFGACEPNTRSGNGPDAFNNNEPHGYSGDYVGWRTGTTSARQYDIICGSDIPRPAPPTSKVVRVIFILRSNGRASGGIQRSNEPGRLPFGREMVGVQDAFFVLLRFRMSLDTMPKAEKHPRTTVLYTSLGLILSNSATRAWALSRHSAKGPVLIVSPQVPTWISS